MPIAIDSNDLLVRAGFLRQVSSMMQMTNVALGPNMFVGIFRGIPSPSPGSTSPGEVGASDRQAYEATW